MPVGRQGRGRGTALAALLLCALALAGRATDPPRITDASAFLDRTEELRIKDHRQFIERLAQIHRESPALTTAEQWHLRYLDALESSLEGSYATAEQPLRDVVGHSGDPTLATKASALLMNNLAVGRRYEDAFQLAQQLTIDLPRIRDKEARLQVLSYLSQTLNLAGQTNLAIKYAHMMEDIDPSKTTSCYSRTKLVAALYNAKRLTSASPELQQAIETCEAAGQPIMATTMQLILGTLHLEEHQPAKTLALLDRIAPVIRINHYYPHTLSAQVQRAQAYAQLGKDDDAQKAALAALAMAGPDDVNDYLKDAYEVLYLVTKRHGNTAAALAYYERYVAQDKGSLNDASAQALAYQTVQQQILTRKLETEELGRQNSVLKLQQALDAKAAETDRLYITLLIILLAAIALWLLRTMRSQRRFKRMAIRDGLTGILNHQHFINEADRILRLLEKKLGHACLISIDLDHFKQINDTHGHAMGDAVLKRAVAICQQHLRPSDLFGRLGGEEFGILLHECSRNQGLDIAERIRIAIGTTPIEKDGQHIAISASVGLASTDTSGYGLQRLCKEADVALYRAKRAGRNRVVADAGNLAEA
ncbi:MULTISPECIES: tetratricopeptide repeat-containing diguanylate cyclase [Rhodanobacter]|uniref:tetratricopeptide repeat-containing diguanylate cyclase n=1 Tax=Rhodanobacter TaxID=75309 RepID=UPI000260FB3C|nr:MULTISPECIES: GGDEF domain-containing protein [Rhodanobacter]EIM01547.1 diguanylate cyclase [Rhodanobacter denitrificans]KZC18514.1 diguanylate cyclase [Rhodanobacter denitrificans]UJJ49806.1 GGDEF domain-containing protein [Rhodanobacter denitrificans]UJM91874.1 GGDEF domain-containing protein [Rhodanobacter denitrificans]UJM92519.1 GGDEF domain-containing protein [Rhodanobacter denitrificans]